MSAAGLYISAFQSALGSRSPKEFLAANCVNHSVASWVPVDLIGDGFESAPGACEATNSPKTWLIAMAISVTFWTNL